MTTSTRSSRCARYKASTRDLETQRDQLYSQYYLSPSLSGLQVLSNDWTCLRRVRELVIEKIVALKLITYTVWYSTRKLMVTQSSIALSYM